MPRKTDNTMIIPAKEPLPSIPKALQWAILVICVLPSVLHLLGIDFSSLGQTVGHDLVLRVQADNTIDDQFRRFSGAFTHTLLEWTAFCIAGFVVIMGLIHYKITQNNTTAIIAIAFFAAGLMDAFHTLAATRLIDSVADNADFIPFSWAISRLFSALILIAGVSVALLRKSKVRRTSDLKFVIGVSLVFGLCAYIIIHLAATSPELPQTIYPDALITRPYDAIPLVLFIFAGLVLYPRLNKRHPSLFAKCLVLSAIPEVITQLHMTFGSTALFDNHFNIAHFLKIIAYSIPLIGLTLDYVQAHKKLQTEIHDRKKAESALETMVLYQQTILATVADAIITVSKSNVIKSFNPAAEAIFGYDKDEVFGCDLSMLIPDQKMTMNRITQGEPTFQLLLLNDNGDLLGRRKDGEIFPIEVTLAVMGEDEENHYVGVLRDLSRLRENENELKSKTEEAESANVAKSQFLAIMSHEIRTPLSVILGILELLDNSSLNDQQLHLIQTGQDSGELLLKLIKDILDFTQMATEQFKLENEDFNLHDLLNSTIELLRHQAEDKNLSLSLILDKDLPQYAQADAGRLRQILLNLVNNAIKFTNEGSIVVEVSAIVDKSNKMTLYCSVKDTGPGIAREHQKSIFNEFTMIDPSYSRFQQGSGLGLAICKRLVVLMEGDIQCHSVIGKGSTFSFNIQLLKITRPEAITASEVTLLSPRKGTRVLLAEDNPANQMIIKSILEFAGLEVVVVGNGLSAVKAIKHMSYDIILMDISMPEMDGITATRKIRRLPGETGKLPIIALTAHALPEDKKLFLAAGMSDYLSKPLDRDIALDCIARWTLPQPGESAEDSALTSLNQQTDDESLNNSGTHCSGYIDEEVLQQLVKDTSADIAPTLLLLYVEDAKKRSNAIRTAVTGKDIDTLEFECHALASAAAAHGNIRLYQVARKVEHLCSEGHHNQALSMATTLLDLADESLRQLKQRAKKGFAEPPKDKS